MNMSTMKRFFALMILVVVALSCVSCSTLQPISANVKNEKYRFGTYSADIETTMFYLDKAVRNACKRARLVKRVHDFRGNACFYKYYDVNQIEVEITLKELKDGSGIKVKIRIGKMGDKESSQKLLLAIDDDLRLLMSNPAQ